MASSTLNLYETEKLLDEVGWAILAELQSDARISFSELGRRVGLTSPAVTERVRRMEEAGIITGYHVRVNPAAVGLGITATMMLVVDDCAWAAEHFTQVSGIELPEILECHRVTGQHSFVLKAVVTSVPHLESLINRLSKFGDVITSIVLSSPISDSPITCEMVNPPPA